MNIIDTGVSRRSFLKTTTALGSGLLISFMIPAYAGRIKKAFEKQPGGDDSTFIPNAFLRVGADGKIKILLAHAEMGQGIWTTLTMMIGEELDADWKNIEIEHAPPGKDYFHTAMPLQITGGSTTTWSEFDRYRKAGATARILLVQAAAKKWGVATESCKTDKGFVLSGDKKLSYAELAIAAMSETAPAEIPLKTKDQWKYIGKGMKRLDAPDKVNGKAIYGMDMQMEGLAIAVVAHCPVMKGKVKSYNASKAKLIKGVTDVIEIPGGVAVLANNYWSALQGKKALQIEWDLGVNATMDSIAQLAQYKKMAATEGLPAAKKGDAKEALKKAAKTLDVEYVFPYLAHAAMEPLNCIVKIEGDHCSIWTGTQLPGLDQAAAAKVLGFKPEQVTLHTVFLGGAFGRRANPASDFVVEAVQIAKASGKAIKMIWSREDDMQSGYYRPFFYHKATIGTDAAGIPTAWYHTIVGQSLMEGTMFEAGIKNGIDDSSVEGIADSAYVEATPDHYIGLHTPKLKIPVLWLRSVGHTHTGYVMETLVDELAHQAGKDPLEYRRLLLKEKPRHLAALNLAAEKAGWGKPLPKGHYHGIAVHESFGSYVSHVAEISISDNGLVKVHKVTCGVDCGLAVNPDGVKAQIESCINYALSIALYGQITFKEGRVQQSNFHDYKVLRLHESPAVIDVHIVETTEKMGGVGEPGVPPLAPAVANAIFAATGKRIRQLPFGETNFKA